MDAAKAAASQEGSMPPFPERARSVHTADGGIVLDVNDGSMFSLNSSGSAIFQLLEQGWAEERISEEIAKRFGISPDVATRDVAAFCSSLKRSNLLPTKATRDLEQTAEQCATRTTWAVQNAAQLDDRETDRQTRLSGDLKFADGCRAGSSTAEVSRETNSPMRFGVLRAYLALVRFEIVLARGNFADLYRAVRRSPCLPQAYNAEIIPHICFAVDLACIWYWKEVLCLQRSAALTCLLKRFGVPAQMVIGTQHMPFKSHAWVEVDGRVINDKPYVSEFFAVLDRC
jgi:hypothetical protein